MSNPFDRYQSSGLGYPSKDDPAIAKGEPQPVLSFYEELSALLNKHSKENESGTPDYILANFLTGCLDVFNTTIRARSNWRGERIDAPFNVKYDEKVRVTLYDEHGRKNEIGEAQLEIWPGETAAHGKITAVIPVFENGTNNPE